jgi:hypothetical protein
MSKVADGLREAVAYAEGRRMRAPVASICL